MSNEATLTTLHKSANWFKATGTLSESYSLVKNKATGKYDRKPMLAEKTTRDEYADGKKTGNQIPCEKIWGGIILKTKDGVFDFQLNFTSKNADGSDNKKWPMALKMLEWNPAIGGDNTQAPSYVTVSGSVSNYDTYSDAKKEVYNNLQWTASAKCEHAECVEDEDGDDNSGCTLCITGFLKSKNWEPDKNNPGENTGRIKAQLLLGDSHGECFPVDIIVDEEIAEDFDDAFEVTDTIDCVLARTAKSVGQKKKYGIGKKNSKTQNMGGGFEVKELILDKANIIEEPDELITEDEEGNEIEVKTQWINPKTMKAALKIREEKLDQLKASGGKKSRTTGMADAIAQSKKKTVGKTNKPVVEDFEDVLNDDIPFDVEDEDDEW